MGSKTEVIKIRIDSDVYTMVKRVAKREFRSYTKQINKILKDWAKKEEIVNIQNSVQHQQVSIDGAD